MFRIVSLLLTCVMAGGAFYGRKYFTQQLIESGQLPGGANIDPLEALEAFNELDALGGGKVPQGKLDAIKSMLSFGSDGEGNSGSQTYQAAPAGAPADVQHNPFFDED